MAETFHVATPPADGRKQRKMHSPLHEMDGDEVPVVRVSEPGTPITIDAFARLLDRKFDEHLEPIRGRLQHLETEASGLNKTVAENKQDTDKKIQELSDHFTQMKLHFANTCSASQSRFSTPRSQDARSQDEGLTAVFGGFKDAVSKEQVDEWLYKVFRNAGAPQPNDTYIKGAMQDFNGIVFGKYSNGADRDAAVKKVQSKAFVFDGQPIWSKMDLPLATRTLESVLFAAKKMLAEWGEKKQNLWVDKDLKCLTRGSG